MDERIEMLNYFLRKFREILPPIVRLNGAIGPHGIDLQVTYSNKAFWIKTYILTSLSRRTVNAALRQAKADYRLETTIALMLREEKNG